MRCERERRGVWWLRATRFSALASSLPSPMRAFPEERRLAPMLLGRTCCSGEIRRSGASQGLCSLPSQLPAARRLASPTQPSSPLAPPMIAASLRTLFLQQRFGKVSYVACCHGRAASALRCGVPRAAPSAPSLPKHDKSLRSSRRWPPALVGSAKTRPQPIRCRCRLQRQELLWPPWPPPQRAARQAHPAPLGVGTATCPRRTRSGWLTLVLRTLAQRWQ